MTHRGDARAVKYFHSASESVRQYLRYYWLANILVHPSLQALLPVTSHGMGGHGNDVGLRESAVPGSDTASRFVTVYFGHLAIHQNDVVMGVLQRVEDLLPVRGRICTITKTLQQS